MKIEQKIEHTRFFMHYEYKTYMDTVKVAIGNHGRKCQD
jgi:hypothetical protein